MRNDSCKQHQDLGTGELAQGEGRVLCTDLLMYNSTTTPRSSTVVTISPFALKSTAVNGVDRVKPRKVVAGFFTEEIKPPFTSGTAFHILPKELLSVVCAVIMHTSYAWPSLLGAQCVWQPKRVGLAVCRE